jgi:hypothetical protein
LPCASAEPAPITPAQANATPSTRLFICLSPKETRRRRAKSF